MEALEGELTNLYLNDESFETNISLKLHKKKVDAFNTLVVKKKERRPEERKRRREKYKEQRQNGAIKKDVLRDQQLKTLREAQHKNIKVCVDLQYEQHMNQKELNQLSNQLKRVYSANKSSVSPFHLYFTHLDGQILNVCREKVSGFDDFIVDFDERSVLDVFDPSHLVYLSPDASQYLTELEEDSTYVIGGLVDDTVQSQISSSFCDKAGLRSCKLPIDLYMDKGATGSFKQILTVNQIFEILLKFYETKDWRVALAAGVPNKTGFVLKPLSEPDLLNPEETPSLNKENPC